MVSSQKSRSKGSVLQFCLPHGSEERRSSSAQSRTAGTESYTAERPLAEKYRHGMGKPI